MYGAILGNIIGSPWTALIKQWEGVDTYDGKSGLVL